MAAALERFKNEYVATFPTDLPRAVGKSFLTSVAVTLLLGGSAEIVLIYGALAATATVIEAIARPLIAPFFLDKPLASKMVLVTVSLMITSRLGDAVLSLVQSTLKIESQIIGGILGALATLYLNNGTEWYDKNKAFIVVI